jgi:hypothetical protein
VALAEENATLIELIRRCAWLFEYYGYTDESREIVHDLTFAMKHAIERLETTVPVGSVTDIANRGEQRGH